MGSAVAENMHVFQRTTILPADIDQVFAFHENPHNIRKISPFFLNVVDVQAKPVATQDTSFTLRLRVFGFHLSWNGLWAEVNKPTLLTDTTAGFPFRKWRHEHRFESVAAGTRMTDSVTYELPYGPIGKLLGATVFRILFLLMFAGRHRATRNYFSRSDRA